MVEEIKVEKVREAYREAVPEWDYVTESGIPVEGVYTPEDVSHIDFQRDIGLPGQYPFTRGHHPLMYRGKLWNMREIAGLSTPAAFNKRCKFLLEEGQGALEWEVDGPTMYGIEPDQPYAEGQFGVCGVSLHTLHDVEVLSQGLPLDEISIGCSTLYPDVWQSLILVAKKRGYDISKLRGVGGAAFFGYLPLILPSLHDMFYAKDRLSTVSRWCLDFVEYVLRNRPRWNLWFISAYDLREAGGNAVHEIAFTLSYRDDLIREMLKRGIEADTTAGAMSPVFVTSRDFFEEIAKLRAAKRIWARTMKGKWGATSSRAMALRFHVDAWGGSGYTRQQPLNNLTRGALGCLAAVLGGCMGIQNPSFDEAWATPTEEAQRLAIRTQQIIRYESGVARVADPLAGSYYVERLTNELEERIMDMYQRIEQMGGWFAVVRDGWPYNELVEGAIERQRKVENGKYPIVGVNCFTIPPEEDFRPQIYAPDISGEVEPYLAEHRQLKERRDKRRLKQALEDLRHTAQNTDRSLVPDVFEALEAEATFAEIIGILRMVDGLEYDWAGEREYPF